MNHNSSIIGQSVDNLPKSNLDNIGSRKPLSCSQAEALDNILTDGPYPLRAHSKINESGYFSTESKLSLLRTTTDSLVNGDEIDEFNKRHLEHLLAEIAEEFGGCWKELGRQLLRKECSIENINEDYNKVKEKSYQMLIQWKKEEGKKASIINIFKSLIYIGREDVAEKLLDYLPKVIAVECEIVLQSSPKKIRCESMTTPIHNINEQSKDLTVEKRLQIHEDEEIYVCSSKITKKKYLLKEMEDSHRSYNWAARIIILDKQLISKKKTLRKTNDFLKDLKFKEEKIAQLKEIIEKLQSKIHIKHMTFCEEELKCHNCEKTSVMRDLIEKELSLLHHELVTISRGHRNRRLSISGIPTERIHNLASRAYEVCEEHKKFHSEFSKVKMSRRCSMELLDDDGDEGGKGNSVEDPVQCTLNILRHFGRKRQVVQSLTVKQRKKLSKQVQRHSSDKSSRSRFYLPSTSSSPPEGQDMARPIWPTRIGSKIFSQRKRSSSEKKQHRKISEPQRQQERPHDEDLVSARQHSRSNTFPSSHANNRPLLFGPGLDDIDDIGSAFSSMRLSNEQLTVNAQYWDDTEEDATFNSSSSAPNLQEMQSRRSGTTQNPFLDTCNPNIINIVSRKKYLEKRQRSFSEDDVNEVTKMYQGGYPQQSSEPDLVATTSVLWKTEIDHEKIFYV